MLYVPLKYLQCAKICQNCSHTRINPNVIEGDKLQISKANLWCFQEVCCQSRKKPAARYQLQPSYLEHLRKFQTGQSHPGFATSFGTPSWYFGCSIPEFQKYILHSVLGLQCSFMKRWKGKGAEKKSTGYDICQNSPKLSMMNITYNRIIIWYFLQLKIRSNFLN